MSVNMDDVRAQAQWEIEIENFERLVEKEKQRLRSKKQWFPWRIRIINVNKGKQHGN